MKNLVRKMIQIKIILESSSFIPELLTMRIYEGVSTTTTKLLFVKGGWHRMNRGRLSD